MSSNEGWSPAGTGMCPHGNFPSSCAACAAEKSGENDDSKGADTAVNPEDVTESASIVSRVKEIKEIFNAENAIRDAFDPQSRNAVLIPMKTIGRHLANLRFLTSLRLQGPYI